MDGSVKAFDRQSQVLKVVDSTVVDSGIYTVVRRRDRADSTVTRGAYATVWRIRAAAEGLGDHEGSPVSRDEEEGEVARSISATALLPAVLLAHADPLEPQALVK